MRRDPAFSRPRSVLDRPSRRGDARLFIRWTALALVLIAAGQVNVSRADDALPRSLDSRIKIELFAEQPQIVTPTGLDVDPSGRVWAIESNTHFPPKDYQGHASDRLLVMSDADGDGRADRIVVFTDDLKNAMSVALRPPWFPSISAAGTPKWSAYVATRSEILLFHDDDGDDQADRKEQIVRLETATIYPHNALAGIAFDGLGWMYFGRGMNHGAEYKLMGSDGTVLSGNSEGGQVYRCRLDGSGLERWATGFWNPHASCFDAFGRLFTVDNDPDSRPPCRLMHVIRGGDFGYRWRNGRAGLHPFTSWNGELLGTLPMVAGTGEAPAGILAYESDGLPQEYIGNLIVTSWGDHRIDRFRLEPRGASFTSRAEPLIVGGEDFRPVGLACAPDGSLYCTDWVKRDYNLHGQGRVWRIAPRERPLAIAGAAQSDVEPLSSKSLSARRTAAQILSKTPEGRAKLVVHFLDPRNHAAGRSEAAFALASVPRSADNILQRFESLWGRGNPVLPFETVGSAETAYLRSFIVDGVQLSNNDRANAMKKLLGLGFVLGRAREEQTGRSESVPREYSCIAATFFDPILIWNLKRVDDVDFRLNSLNAALEKCDKFEFLTLVNALAAGSSPAQLKFGFHAPAFTSDIARAGLVLAGRKQSPAPIDMARLSLADKSAIVRRVALQWVAEERLTELRPQVAAMLDDPAITADLFLATLAALEMLDGVPPAQFDKTPAGKYVLPIVADRDRPATLRALALRMVDPADGALHAELLGELLESDDPTLRLEAVRTLQSSPIEQVSSLLGSIAADEEQDEMLRAEAIMGLARGDGAGKLSAEIRDLLLDFLTCENPALRSEALRSLRGFVTSDSAIREAIEQLGKASAGSTNGALAAGIEIALNRAPRGHDPQMTDADWQGGNAADGRRVFFHANGAGCFKCHTVNGRGGKVGPDLSTIARSHDRKKLIESIFEPGKEVAPDFATWTFESQDGKVYTGTIVHENEGKTIVGDAEGRTIELKTIDIVTRVPQQKSTMPEKLGERMTLEEFRNLIVFLESLK